MTQSPLIQNYLKMFRNYATFTGRTSRAEFWWAYLMNYIIIFVLNFISSFISSYLEIIGSNSVFFSFVSLFFSGIYALYSLIVYVPMLSLQIRRLHDTNRSGWWILFSGTGIGGILLLIWYCTAGTEDTNLFGSDPNPIRQY